jgi:hypothetical protein
MAWPTSRSGHLTPEEKTLVSMKQKAIGGQEPIWMLKQKGKSVTLPEISIHSVAGHYTNNAVLNCVYHKLSKRYTSSPY